ncbi:MAG TPA: 2-amino-4-hydroxy-6-hydroxymethyldihydropteridine diphosphokinase [Planctomycetaceae bacterium]|nr:2-amino-4-hydroxy-6-hydroxymethyldihydropteridine diphosphokinase [Planctomycetaceae bacterium]
MARAWIALGGNLGNVPQTFRAACLSLSRQPELELIRSSGIYRTAPVGDDAGSAFFNAATAWETALSPLELLQRLQQAEDAAGRTRDLRWGPRPLDLDLIQFGDTIVQKSQLTVPHPAAWYRRFVLDPVCEFAPDVRHPLHWKPWGELRQRLLPRPLRVAIFGGSAADRTAIVATLKPAFPAADLRVAESASEIPDAGLRVWLGPTTDGLEFQPPPLSVNGSSWGAQSIEQARYVLTSALDVPERIGDWPAAPAI